jgi:UDP-N-acetylglucosamine 4,6-dehydratase
MQGGEIFVPVLPAIALPDLARAVIQAEGEPGWPVAETGWRPGGEKLHERLLTREELTRTLARQDHVLYVVTPHIRTWSEVPYAGAAIQTDWEYTSEAVPWRLSAAEMVESLRRMDGEQ